jgi:hypothetical protein
MITILMFTQVARESKQKYSYFAREGYYIAKRNRLALKRPGDP